MRVADHSGERPAWWVLAAAALASFILHIPFLTTPLSVDEGGYGYVARWWASGADLYGDIWVDRPQGLLLLYRWAEALPGSDRFDIRLMAALWSCAIAVVLGLLMTQVAGRRAGAAAALLSGLLSTSPVIEGFSANGELMATLPALVALALTARWQLRGGLGVMFAAGLFAGAAFLVKQSGYDGGLAAGLWLLLAAWRGWRPAGEALRALGALALGVALIIGLAALHGALTGWHDWWFAIADYRLSVESVATGSVSEKFSLFTDSLRTAGPVVGVLFVLALPGLWLALRRPETVLVALWFGLSLTGFALGGLFHGHYYVGPLTPLCALAALTLAAVPLRAGLALGVLGARAPRLQGLALVHGERHARALARVDVGLAHRQRRRRRPLPERPHEARRHDLCDVRQRGPVSGVRAPLALPVPLVPGHRAHPRRAAAAARHARRPGGAALHRGLPAAEHDRQERSARRHRPTLTRRYTPRGDDRGSPDLAPER